MRASVAALPALFVFTATLVIYLASGQPEGLFLTSSIRVIPIRFLFITIVLTLPVLALPKLLALVGEIPADRAILGKTVRAPHDIHGSLSWSIIWLLRPVQGISLSLIFAERVLSILEYSVGASLAQIFARLILFLVGGAVSSLFLSTVWALDDLGVKFYFGRTGEIRMAGSSIGTVIPLITGAIGITSVFHSNLPMDAFMNLFQTIMILYPPYVVFILIHHKFVVRRRLSLLKRLRVKRIETKVG